MKTSLHIDPENIEQSLLKIGENLAITTGEYKYKSTCSVDDLDWNHMDWAHRPTIHQTYTNSVRIFASPTAAISLTEMRFFGIRFFIQVSDSKLAKGLFYQSYTVFGLIYIHGVLSNNSENFTFKWYIISPKWLKPLHAILSKKLFNLNHTQVAEDQVIRKRRAQLRSQGYGFGEVERDFITSNDNRYRTEYPPITGKYSFDLSTYAIADLHEISVDNKLFFVRKTLNQQVELWPKVCPHEGGELNKKDLCEKGDMICPLHAFRIKPLKISSVTARSFGASFSYNSEQQILFVN